MTKAKKPEATRSNAKSQKQHPAQVVGSMVFRRGRDGRVIHMDVKTRPQGKTIVASQNGRVKAIAMTH